MADTSGPCATCNKPHVKGIWWPRHPYRANVRVAVEPPPTPAKEYLGDGCYVQFDGYQLVLTTSNGIEDTNTIALDPEVYAALVAYVARLKGQVPT